MEGIIREKCFDRINEAFDDNFDFSKIDEIIEHIEKTLDSTIDKYIAYRMEEIYDEIYNKYIDQYKMTSDLSETPYDVLNNLVASDAIAKNFDIDAIEKLSGKGADINHKHYKTGFTLFENALNNFDAKDNEIDFELFMKYVLEECVYNKEKRVSSKIYKRIIDKPDILKIIGEVTVYSDSD